MLCTHFARPASRCAFRCGARAAACARALSLGASSFVCELSSGVVLLVLCQPADPALHRYLGVAAYGIIANLALVG